MAGHNIHKIQKQYLNLHLETEKEAFRRQTAFRSAYYEQVLPAFEEVLDRFSREGVTIRLDRIHLDLGDLDLDEIDGRFAEVAARALSEQLSLLIPKAEMGQVDGVEIMTGARSEMGLLVRFLKTGTLPWWSGKEAPDPRRLFSDALETRPQALMEELARSYPGTAMLHRLARQFPATSVIRLIAVSQTAVSDRIHRLLEALLELAQKPSTAFSWTIPQVLEVALEQVFAEVAGGKKAIPAAGSRVGEEWKETGPELIRALAAKTGRPAAELTEEIRKALKTKGLASGSRQALQAFVEAVAPPFRRSPEEDPQAEAGIPKKEKNTGQTPAEPSKSTSWRPEEGEEIYIENAGLALAGGFFEFLFGNLGYLDGKQFRDEESRERAVYLLEFLVRGETPDAPPEEALFLNKILCGFPPDEVLSPLPHPLTETETHEAENLLKAMIGYWKDLGNITPDDLRKAFLQREGRLRLNNSEWELKVDRQTIDVLLEKIPWTTGRIEHAWMINGIVVDW